MSDKYQETQCGNHDCQWYVNMMNNGYCTTGEGTLTQSCNEYKRQTSHSIQINPKSESSFIKFYKTYFIEKPTLISGIFATILLLMSTTPVLNEYYNILKWVICILAIYVIGIGFLLWQRNKNWWVSAIFSCIAIIFNPINPADLTKIGWIIAEIICSGLFIYIAFSVKKLPKEKWDILYFLGALIAASFYLSLAFGALMLLRELLMIFD